VISRVRLACALAIPLALLADARAASLLYSNDVLGEIEPCGCRVDPMGGLVRRSGLLERLKKEGKGPFVQVDGGDLLFETKDFPESLEKSRRLQAEALLEAYGRMGLDAFVPGEKDFALGLKTLRSLLAKSKVKALAANLMEGDKPAFPGSAVFEAKGADGKVVRVCLIGLVGESIEYPAPI
jgi:2',3'-cyclic-nucleotide 2'-phosphodiesterase (5'-nucleotidase family)